jgi:hypothetical protein
MAFIATCLLKSNSPYSPSRIYTHDDGMEMKPKEGHDAYEKRTWREKGHYDKEGRLVIPAIKFKKSLEEAAMYLGERIPGKGTSTYAKHFLAGVMVFKDLPLGIKKADVKCWKGMQNSDGKRGGGKRVLRFYPTVDSWQGVAEFHIVDSTITREVFERTLRCAGSLVGIGRWRPRNGGLNGRFSVEKVSWAEYEV